jgi:hypothetical protein
MIVHHVTRGIAHRVRSYSVFRGYLRSS